MVENVFSSDLLTISVTSQLIQVNSRHL